MPEHIIDTTKKKIWPWQRQMWAAFGCENSALYHDLRDQNRYPFLSVQLGLRHEQPGYSNHIIQQNIYK